MPGSAFLAFACLNYAVPTKPAETLIRVTDYQRREFQGIRMRETKILDAEICEFGLRNKLERAIEPYERDIGFGRFCWSCPYLY